METKKINFNEPFLTGNEEDYISKTFKNKVFYGTGDFTKKVTQKIQQILDIPFVLLTDSCTSALEISSLCIQDEKEKNEIIIPSYTFSSTANAFAKHGYVVKFVDISPSDMMISPEILQENISSKTKAVVAVHYGSHIADVEELKKICELNDILLIEDAAQAFGSKINDKNVGTYGNYGCFSFHETKNLHCGLGGAFVTDCEESYEKAVMIWERGTNRQQKLRGLVDKYTWRELGGSHYPSEMQAAFLLAQLEEIENNFSKRKKIYNFYSEALESLEKKSYFFVPKLKENVESNYHSFYIITRNCDERDNLMGFLQKNNIYAYVGYVPLHSSPMGKRIFSGNLHNTDEYASRILRLPFHNNLTEDDLRIVASKIKDFYE